MSWLQDMFHVEKPIIALLHLRAMPGDPLFKEGTTMADVINQAKDELLTLQTGGVDGILFANEFSLPYEKNVSYATIASMARIIGELKHELQIPFGVNVVSNPAASIELAAATDASFVRGTFTGAYIGEGGIIDTDVAATLRRKKALGLNHLKLLFKVNPESDTYMAECPIKHITKSVIFHCFPDALCVSGASAGGVTDSNMIREIRESAGQTPLLCNTGCTAENIAEKLALCDGACVGTWLKKDGCFENAADLNRVKHFMKQVTEYRAAL